MYGFFGKKVRGIREKRRLYLREIAPKLNIDIAQLSKIEKGTRQIKKEQISVLAEILKTNKIELETLWLADQVSALIRDEPFAEKVLKTILKELKKI